MVTLNYEDATRHTKQYIENPMLLKQHIEDKFKTINKDELPTPYPDRFAFWHTYFKGFYNNPERLKNYIGAMNNIFTTQKEYLPNIADIEPNSSCNFRCTMCQVSEWENGKRARDMTLEELKSIYMQNPYFTEIKLHGMGEPFLNKSYTEMVEFLSSKDIWVRTSTNGSLLHLKDNYKKLIDAEIGEAQCSLDGATKDIYESIRVGGNFDLVAKNFKLLNSYANQKQRLYTRAWVVVQKRNRHQLLDFVELAKSLEFRRISFSLSLNDWGQDSWKQKNAQQEAARITPKEKDLLLEARDKYQIDITVWEQSNKYSVPDGLCYWPFNRPYISSDGRFAPCCMIGNPEVVDFGSVYNFKENWNSKDYIGFRQLHLNGNIPTCCKNCYSNAK